MAVTHVAMFRFTDDATTAAIAALGEGLAALPGEVPSLRSLAFGPDLGLLEGLSDASWDYAVVATFDDAEGYHAYRTHPAHLAVVEERLAPIAADRATIQLAGTP
ncbi:MAG: Dabb family protein [Actinomycetota bacterium]